MAVSLYRHGNCRKLFPPLSNWFLSRQAQQVLSACQEKVDVSNTEGYELFITQLKDGLKNTSHETAANHKVAKVSRTGCGAHLVCAAAGFSLNISVKICV